MLKNDNETWWLLCTMKQMLAIITQFANSQRDAMAPKANIGLVYHLWAWIATAGIGLLSKFPVHRNQSQKLSTDDVRCITLIYAAHLFTCPIHRHKLNVPTESEGLKSSSEGSGQPMSLQVMIIIYLVASGSYMHDIVFRWNILAQPIKSNSQSTSRAKVNIKSYNPVMQ